MTTFSIILADDVRVDPRRHALTVSTILNIPQAEAKILIRRGRGIFMERLEADPAKAISQNLHEDHVRHWMVDEATLPVVPPIKKTVVAEGGEEMFTYRPSQATDMEAMAWEDLASVSCGAIVKIMHKDFVENVPFEMIPGLHTLEDEETKAILHDGMIRMTTQKKAAGNKAPGSLESLLDVFDVKYGGKVMVMMDLLNGDTSEHLRIQMEQFGYSPEEGKRKLGGQWGLRHFLEAIQKRVPPEALTPVTLHFLKGSDITDVLFSGMEEFNRYTTWFVHRRYCQQHLGTL